MLDIHVVHARARAKVHEIDLLSQQDLKDLYGVNVDSPTDLFTGNNLEFPLVLDLKGPDFTSAWSARVNGEESAFNVLSKERILVTVPKHLEERPIQSVDIFLDVAAISVSSSLFEFGFTRRLTTVNGRAKLLGQFIKVLLTTRGSDIFEPMIGGDLQKWPGRNFNSAVPEGLVALTTLQILSAAEAFIKQQSPLQLPADEKLLTVDVMSVETSPVDSTMVNVRLKLVPYSGTNIFAELLVSANTGATS